MNLKDFVKVSLVQIAQGIQEASEELKDTNAFINPKNIYVNAENRQNYGRLMQEKEFHPVVELVEFDIAVYAKKKIQNQKTKLQSLLDLLKLVIVASPINHLGRNLE